jgi:LysR family transcriptional regulator, regulator of abg operon
LLRLNQIRDFLTVLDCGSVRAAAARLSVSQPAVTKSVRSLEAELGVELLRRSNSGVTATVAGAAFAARARVAQLELQRAREEVGGAGGRVSMTLNIGLGSAPLALLGTGPLVRFLTSHPDTRMHIIEGPGQTLLPLVRDGTIDLALVQRVEPAAAPGLKFRPLIRTRLVVVGRKGHPLAKARSLGDLRGARWLVYRPPKSHGVLEDALRAEGVPFPTNYVQCESFALTAALLRDSDLLGLLVPQALGSQHGNDLQEIPLKRPLPEISVGMYRRADTPTSAPAGDLWGHLVRAVREHSAHK